MSKREWTDLDYAQAAIDMLPGSVEEIKKFMPRQKIPNKWVNNRCPVRQHVQKWVGGNVRVGFTSVFTSDWEIMFPPHIREYILWVDRLL